MEKQKIISIVSLVVIIALLVVTRIVGGNRSSETAPDVTEAPTEVAKNTTKAPTKAPTKVPTETAKPTEAPTNTPVPTKAPTEAPTPSADPTPTPTPSPSPVPTAAPAPTLSPEHIATARAVMEKMTVEEKIYQLFLVTPEQLTGIKPVTGANDRVKEAIRNKPVGGLIFAAQNVNNKDQLTALLSGSAEASKYGLFLTVQDETGALTAPAGTAKIAKASELGGDASKAAAAAASLGKDLRALGFNLNLAPVSDLSKDGASFGTDAKIVSDMVAAYVKAGASAGLPGVLLHFPIHSTEKSTRSLKDLQAAEFTVFQSGINSGASIVMVGYAEMRGLSDRKAPASLNPDVIGILRKELGFSGIVMTEAMDAKTITGHYDSDKVAVMAIQAGADIIYRPADLNNAYKGISNAVKNGTISEDRLNESVLRILAVKAQYGILKQQ